MHLHHQSRFLQNDHVNGTKLSCGFKCEVNADMQGHVKGV